jgi:hypothetical protein
MQWDINFNVKSILFQTTASGTHACISNFCRAQYQYLLSGKMLRAADGWLSAVSASHFSTAPHGTIFRQFWREQAF